MAWQSPAGTAIAIDLPSVDSTAQNYRTPWPTGHFVRFASWGACKDALPFTL